MTFIVEHSDGTVKIDDLLYGKRKIIIESNGKCFVSNKSCVTSYPIELIKKIIKVKGIKWLCDEIMRDEDPTYVQRDLNYSILSYIDETCLNNKRILDFGCGCGASTMIIARNFPSANIVGVELDKNMLNIAKYRAKFYAFENIQLIVSPSGNEIPENIECFDYILMSAVYEHLLPTERITILTKLWGKLNKGGILFINQTPDRRFPIETHTTGLPLINYLPDKAAHFLSCKFSQKVLADESWNSLLRRGIRGSTISEIMKILFDYSTSGTPILLRPKKLGIKKQSDVWYKASRERVLQKFKGTKRDILFFIINLVLTTNIPVAPYLSLAIRKS